MTTERDDGHGPASERLTDARIAYLRRDPVGNTSQCDVTSMLDEIGYWRRREAKTVRAETTALRDDGYGPYNPVSDDKAKKVALDGHPPWDFPNANLSRIVRVRMARELLHLRERTATLESQLSEQEMANSRLEGDSLDLHEKIDEWKAASGLSDSSGDPDSIEPRHLARRIREDDSRHRLLLRELDAERKVHASTALALDTAGAKVAVIERLETWLKGDSNRLIEASYGSAHWAYASLSNDGCYLAGDSNNETDTVAAIDAALRDVEST